MKLCMERSWMGRAGPPHAGSEGSVGRVQGVQEVELLAPKDHRSVLNIAFEEIVDIGSGKVKFSPLLSCLNRLVACSPVVFCMVLRVVAWLCVCCASQA
jgi:hypothetical protein